MSFLPGTDMEPNDFKLPEPVKTRLSSSDIQNYMESEASEKSTSKNEKAKKEKSRKKSKDKSNKKNGHPVAVDMNAFIVLLVKWCTLFTDRLEETQVDTLGRRFYALFPAIQNIPSVTSDFENEYKDSQSEERRAYMQSGLLFYVNLALRTSLAVCFKLDQQALDNFCEEKLGESPIDAICQQMTKSSNSLIEPKGSEKDEFSLEKVIIGFEKSVGLLLNTEKKFVNFLKSHKQ